MSYFNPGYIKLMMSACGHLDRDYDDQVYQMRLQYYHQNRLIAVPLIAKKSVGDFEMIETLRDHAKKSNIGILQLYTTVYVDERNNMSYTNAYPYLHNTNYSYRSREVEMMYASLLTLLELDYDGENKIIVYNPRNSKTLRYGNLSDFINSGGSEAQLDEYQRENKIEDDLLNFLSLFWKFSRADVYGEIKTLALLLRYKLIKSYTEQANYAELNIFNSIVLDNADLEIIRFSMGQMPDTDDQEDSKIVNKESFQEKIDERDQYEEEEENYQFHSKSHRLDELDEEIIRNVPDLLFQADDEEEAIDTYNGLLNDVDFLPKSSDDVAVEQPVQEITDLEHLEHIIESTDIAYKSKVFLKSALYIRTMLHNEADDYSPVLIGYSKFFEHEINLSIVQSIRQFLGITMPTYYLKYCDVAGKYIIKGRENFSADFNMKHYTSAKYIPPGLGQSLISYRILSENPEFPNYEKRIKELGLKINAIRNKVAHPEILSKEDLLEMEQLIGDLNREGLINVLVGLRKELVDT